MKFSELRQENRRLKEHLDIANRVIDIQDERIEYLYEETQSKDKQIWFYLSATINIGLGIILLFVGAR